MRQKEIILSVTNNLETDQRVNKIANTLKNMGFSIIVVGSDNRECHEYNPGYRTKRLHVFFKKGFLFYLEFNIRLFFFLLANKFDVCVSNDTDTVLPNFFACKIKRKNWVADFHELFPEVPEVTNRKKVKFVWTKIEDFIFPHIKYGYTVCQSISDYYYNKYNIRLKVVRNIPNYVSYEGKKNKIDTNGKKIILYQGAVNVGRGIEWIMDAMKYIDDAIFIVIGKGDLYEDLCKKSLNPPYKDKVLFLGHIPYSELKEYTLSADLGVCLLKHQGLSYYYALPNRVFDFMQAHVPLLATNFPEISRIVTKEKTGLTINTEDAKKISEYIKFMLNQEINHEHFEEVSHIYTWENEENILHEIYGQFL